MDGVIQAPGGPGEDPSGGFEYGGWIVPYSDEVLGNVMQQQMAPADMLLGRKTFENFAAYWPQRADNWPGINDVTKYVLSNTVTKSDWNNCVFLTNVADIENLKKTEGGDLKVWGSGQLVQLLLKHNLVDELWLKIYPVLLGKGKKLYNDDIVPAAFKLTESTVTAGGVIVANYKRDGDVKTGSFGD